MRYVQALRNPRRALYLFAGLFSRADSPYLLGIRSIVTAPISHGNSGTPHIREANDFYGSLQLKVFSGGFRSQ